MGQYNEEFVHKQVILARSSMTTEAFEKANRQMLRANVLQLLTNPDEYTPLEYFAQVTDPEEAYCEQHQETHAAPILLFYTEPTPGGDFSTCLEGMKDVEKEMVKDKAINLLNDYLKLPDWED